MPMLHVRVSDGNHAYVTEQAEETGLSQAVVVGLLLTEIRRRGWKIAAPGSARIIEEGEPECTSS